MERAIWKFRKAWSRTLGQDSGLSWATRFVACLEIVFSAILLVVLWTRPVDWHTQWPSDFTDFNKAMPWAHWLVTYLISSSLIFHGIWVLQRKRWAVVFLGIMSLMAAVSPFLLAASRMLAGSSPSLSIASFGWVYIHSLIIKDGFLAFVAKPELQAPTAATLEAPAPPRWIT